MNQDTKGLMYMFTILFLNQKGGVGKTTLADELAFDGYLVREQGLDEDGVEPGEVIVLEEYMEGVPQESRGLGTSDVHGV